MMWATVAEIYDQDHILYLKYSIVKNVCKMIVLFRLFTYHYTATVAFVYSDSVYSLYHE